MDATSATGKMLSEPDKFFEYYPVFAFGGASPWNANTINARNYFLAKKDAGQAGHIVGKKNVKEGHFGATRPGFLHTKDISSFVFQPTNLPAPPGASAPVVTHGVPMVNYNSTVYGCSNLNGNIVAMPHYVVGTAARYMTTGALSGCCFAWITNGNDLWCAHVQPKDGITGQVLHQQMVATGRFAAAPLRQLSTFGRNDYGGNGAIVIGVNGAGGWRLYAQTSIDGFKTINGAYRLHPNRAVL